ncbi:DNAj-related [Schistosoma mansoni]|uniref:DNAj-related n=1 Tax=Schistosoma mansoni TaxID=6183 RepID=UPI0001A64501|nr:DNAj-related [Schistosoma mansoni]|eukprot:XP_018652708.1 DNAj-related [Schistosoma mansoni]
MPGDRFEFDESGDTFLCFLTAFYTLVLIPLTYFCWPSLEFKESYEQSKRKCMCQPCQLKRHHIKSSTPLKRLKKIMIKAAFVAGWGIFFLLVYKLTLIEPDNSGFDPFLVLGLDKDASPKDIRSAYKKLSLLNHPDKGGDPKRFIQISKAYNALTNEESRKNWEEYGNPDGPGAAHFGIALPKWMVQKENFYLVIGAYILLFMMILPISVGVWWYNTMKFSNNNVLLDTIRYFCGAFMRSPYMAMPRIIKVLSTAYEFNPNYNKEIICRPSDNTELPPLIMQIPFFTIFKKAIVGSPYSVKARALIYAHLERLELPANTLHVDRQYIIKHSPRLIDEMINSLLYVLAVAMDEANSRHKTPQHLATIENCMHLIPMLVQALTDNASPLLQLPHITQTQLRHMATKQRNIKSVRQLINLPDDKRRALLRSLSDEQYRDILTVSSSMPYLELSYRCEVLDEDEDDSSIWPFSMVTVTVVLKRKPLLDPNAVSNSSYFDRGQTMQLDWNAYNNNDSLNSKLYPIADIHGTETLKSLNYDDFLGSGGGGGDEDKGFDNVGNSMKSSKKTTPPVWDKSKRKKGVRKSKSRKQQQQQQRNSLLGSEKVNQSEINPTDEIDSEQEDSDSVVGIDNESVQPNHIDGGQVQRKTTTDTFVESSLPSSLSTNKSSSSRKPMKPHSKLSSMMDSKTHCTHVVHCPYFPVEKFEGWWIYLADRKTRQLITKPIYIATLQTEEELQLRFVAPPIPGQYLYVLSVRSDSYMDCDFTECIRFTVRPLPERIVEILKEQEEAASDDDDDSSDTSSTDTEDDDEVEAEETGNDVVIDNEEDPDIEVLSQEECTQASIGIVEQSKKCDNDLSSNKNNIDNQGERDGYGVDDDDDDEQNVCGHIAQLSSISDNKCLFG